MIFKYKSVLTFASYLRQGFFTSAYLMDGLKNIFNPAI
jgi:hypothetical protein